MENHLFFEKSNQGVNLNPEQLDEVNSTYELITGSDEQLTFKEYFFAVLRKAISVAKAEPADNSPLINELQEEMDQLRLQLDNEINARKQLENDNAALMQEKQDLNNVNEELKQAIEAALTREPEPIAEALMPGAGQLIVTLTPFENHLIEKVAEMESQRVNEPITFESLLKRVFFKFVIDGPGDYFRRPFKDRELKEIRQKFPS